jgi:hypothetical protein
VEPSRVLDEGKLCSQESKLFGWLWRCFRLERQYSKICSKLSGKLRTPYIVEGACDANQKPFGLSNGPHDR